MTKAKIYSVNLAAFLFMIRHLEPTLDKDANGSVYFLFPDDMTTTLIINTYRRNRVSVDLKEYLSSYRHIRNMMRAFK